MPTKHLFILFSIALASVAACSSGAASGEGSPGEGSSGEGSSGKASSGEPESSTSGSSPSASSSGGTSAGSSSGGQSPECAEGEAKCIGQNEGAACADGEWQYVSCTDLCVGEGYDTSLACVEAGGSPTCECRQTCYGNEGMRACSNDAQTLYSCEEIVGQSVWQPYDCDAVCKDDGYKGSYGCGYVENEGAYFCQCFD